MIHPIGARAGRMPFTPLLALMLAALAMIKVGFLVSFGPTIMPDSSGYIEFADFMLRGQLTGSGLTEGDFPATLFRMAGYPAIIATTKAIAGEQALWLVVSFQFAAALVATMFVYFLARMFAIGAGLSLLVAAAQATSLPLALDQVIITDSLNASILTIAICLLAGAVLNRHLSIFAALGAGLAISAAFLLREATLILAVGLIPLVFTAVFVEWLSDDSVTKERKPLWHGALKLACIIFPLLIVQQAYREWNRSRIGAPIITTGAQTAVLSALVDAAREEPAIFSGDTPLDRVARTTLRTFDFTEVREINKRLYREYGHSAIQMADDAYTAYFRAWREHPMTMLRLPLTHLREWQARLTVRPMASVRELILWNTGSDHDFASERALLQGRWSMTPAVMLRRISETVAIVVFAGFLLLTPWRALREGLRSPANMAATCLWVLYLFFFTAYAFVHLEPRYLAPVIPGSLVVGVVNLQWTYRRLKQRRQT